MPASTPSPKDLGPEVDCIEGPLNSGQGAKAGDPRPPGGPVLTKVPTEGAFDMWPSRHERSAPRLSKRPPRDPSGRASGAKSVIDQCSNFDVEVDWPSPLTVKFVKSGRGPEVVDPDAKGAPPGGPEAPTMKLSSGGDFRGVVVSLRLV